MKSKDHQQLMSVLRKMTKQEKWRRMPKKTGKVTDTEVTKSGNIKLVFDETEKVYVLRKNKNLYDEASLLVPGDYVMVALRSHLGKQYCTKVVRKRKEERLDTWI